MLGNNYEKAAQIDDVRPIQAEFRNGGATSRSQTDKFGEYSQQE